MSCFFDALCSSLSVAELVALGVKSRHPLAVIPALQKRNRDQPDVMWQNRRLTNQEQRENFVHVRDYDKNSYSSGYLTSSADPFLILASQIFLWKIEFSYDKAPIRIEHDTPFRTLRFRASRSHFERA